MKLHFVGIAGSGISGVAKLAEKMGHEVTGCDLTTGGHSPDHIKNVDLVIVTPAVFYQSAKHPEIVEGSRRGIVMTWQEFAGRYLAKGKKVICVAGTHGKSTTTAMTGKLLVDVGLDPTVVIGAVVPEWNGSSRFGRGEYFVIEADEFNDNFLNYNPEIIILNNIEFDHPDYFKNEKQVFESFKKLIGNLVGEKILIVNWENAGIRKLFGGRTDFVKVLPSQSGNLALKIPGKYNISNAAMVIALGKKLGLSDALIKKSLSSFTGIERRSELLAEKSGIAVYDDYAHHPTAIAATLSGIREGHPSSRIWAVDEPHGFARTKALLAKYKAAFKDADKVIIGPIFRARDSETFGMTSQVVAKASGHPDVIGTDSLEEIKKILKKELRRGDVILVMGAGKSSQWAKEITQMLPLSFADLTTFKVGGKIKYFFAVKTKEEIERAVKFAKERKLPVFIIGGGSDILVSDAPFDGVVIKYTGTGVRLLGEKIIAEAGMKWDDLVDYSVKNSLQGIECLSGIPGTVGGSPIQNIGAYGQELNNTFVSLTAYDIKKEKFVIFNNKDCHFSYRESVFKDPAHWQRYIITDVTLRLTKNKKPEVKYDSLKNYLDERGIKSPSLAEVRESVLAIRESKFEDPKEVGNAGSFFKNPIVDDGKLKFLEKKYPDLKAFGNKLSAGWLIEKAGWKGKTYKGAEVSPRHALVLINPKGRAKAEEIVELSEKIIEDVDKKFGIRLEREVQLVNFKKVAILGYGIEGKDAEKFLKKQGAKITILDKKFDENYLKGLKNFDVIVRSPGVYRFLPEIIKAEKEGVEVSSAVKIFFENCPGKIIGVTGTKGKGTTATLIYEILEKDKRDVHLAGNIGKPYLELLPKLTKESFVILEMSSFQLIDMEVSPHIAVVLNITADHLDWHKNIREYVDAKKNIVAHQASSDFAVINEEYKVPKSFAKLTKGKVVFFSKGKLEDRFKNKLLLRGEHNLENIAAATAVAEILKVGEDKILEAVRNFKGLEHRLELVGSALGRTFYNDSFATGPQPTIAAIRSFNEPETLILGGSDKGLDYSELRSEIEKRDNVKNLILIGVIGEKIGLGIEGKNVINLGKTSMIRIIEKAYEVTPKGGVIILSPAAASFDMFENYKDRGNQFKAAVLNLKNEF